MAGIFLSYSRADRPLAQTIAEALQVEGFTVWWDKVLRAGQTYDEVTENMLRESDIVVVLWSHTSVKSKWVRAEATLGERTAVVVPAMIEDAERPIMFELTQSADLIGWSGDTSDQRWKEFIKDLRQAVEKSGKSSGAPAGAVASTAPAASPEDTSIEMVFWTSIKDGNDPADFEAYLKRYPNGHYSDLARNRLAAMVPDKPVPAPNPGPQMAAAAPAKAAPASTPSEPPAKNKSSPIPMLVGGLVLLGVAGWAVNSFILKEKTDTSGALAVETPPAETALVAEPDGTPDSGTEPAATTSSQTSPSDDPSSPPQPETDPVVVCDDCPDMVQLVGGRFTMGSPSDEANRSGNEGPQREVTLPAFAISRTEITQKQWAACAEAQVCEAKALTDDGSLPVASVSWEETQTYTSWLSNKTGQSYRLPSEAEWEFAARGGTQFAYWWGSAFRPAIAAGSGPRPVGELPNNPFELAGMLGNVREWTQDCYVNNYTDAPTDGRATVSGDCSRRVVRGGSWRNGAAQHRAANRARVTKTVQDRSIGFRVVLEIN